jgi:hypothetical protein
MGGIETLTTLVEALYKDLWSKKEKQEFMKSLKEQDRIDDIKLIYEAFFIFGLMWAFGAPLNEGRIPFSNSVRGMSKPKMPDGGMCWDYFFDPL